MAFPKVNDHNVAVNYNVGQSAAVRTGRVFYVDSGADGASNSNPGDSPRRPLATIEGAFNHGDITANNGDIVFALPGHSETITAAAGIDADIAGVRVIGVGDGRDRPTINFTTSTSADIDIDAANITFENLFFDVTGVDGVTAALDVNAADFTFKNCEVLGADSGGQMTEFILTDANAHRMRVLNNVFRSPDAGANNVVSIVGTPDGIEIAGNYIHGDFADACIHNPTSNVATNLWIHDNYLQNDQTNDHAIELVSACTGVIANNLLATDAIATAADWGACSNYNNKYYDVSTADAKAVDIPLTATDGSTQDLVNVVDALYGSTGVATFPASAAPANGVSLAEVLRSVYDQTAYDGTAGVTVMSGLGRRVNKVGDVSGTEDRLFTVTGKNLITLITGEVTSVIATTTSLQLRTSTNDIVLHASTDIVTDVAGTLYIVSGDPDDVLNGGSVPNADVAFIKTGTISPIVMNDDAIDQIADQAGTGLIEWVLYYIPLEASASIASAA